MPVYELHFDDELVLHVWCPTISGLYRFLEDRRLLDKLDIPPAMDTLDEFLPDDLIDFALNPEGELQFISEDGQDLLDSFKP